MAGFQNPSGGSGGTGSAGLTPPLALTSFTTHGHSYEVGTNVGAFLMAPISGLAGRIASLLNVPVEDHLLLAQSGSFLTNNYAQGAAGWGMSWQYLLPNEATGALYGSGEVTSDQPINQQPGGHFIGFGINDPLKDGASWPTQGINAWKNALTALISRCMAGAFQGTFIGATPGTVLVDASIVAGGGFSAQAGTNFNSGPGYVQALGTNGATVTITLPADFPGGTVAVCFIGQANGYTTLAAPGLTIGALSMNVASAAEFPTSGTYVARIAAEGANTTEDVLITAGAGTTAWTITRGVNGTAASPHGIGAVVTIEQTFQVNWSTSGSNPAISGSTVLGGQGYFGNNVPVVTRFPCTAADAGKTIVATSAGVVVGDTSAPIIFDSWWTESPTPPPIAVANVPRFSYGSFWNANDPILVTPNHNAATAAVIANFGSNVKLADFDGVIAPRSGILAAPGMTAGTTSLPFTANGTAQAPFGGQRLRIFDLTNGSEDVLVTNVGGTFPNYSLTVTRGFNGTAAVLHPAGCWVGDASWVATDDVHPNFKGSALLANAVVTALQNAVQSAPTATQQTNLSMAAGKYRTSTLAVPWVPPIVDNGTHYLAGTASASTQLTLGQLFVSPFFVPQICVLTGMGVEVVTAGTTNSVRLGLYGTDGEGRASGLIADWGTVGTGSIANNVGVTGLWKLLRPGWYWPAVVSQGGTGAFFRTTGGAPTQMAFAQTYSATFGFIGGYSVGPGVTGALPAVFSQYNPATGGSNAAILRPMVWMTFRAPQH